MTKKIEMDRRAFLKTVGAAGLVIGSGGLSNLLVACGPTTSNKSTGNPVRGGKMTLATLDTPINLDPQDEANYASAQVFNNIFSTLVDMDVDYKIHPSLAHSWTQEDAMTWTFNLVDNAVFHNGQPLTANDVKFSFERVRNHNNAVYLSAFKSIEVLGKYQVRFHLTGPLGPLFQTLSSFSHIVNEQAVTTQDPKLHPVGTGPFKFAEWVQNDHITLNRWDKYFQSGLPYLDQVVFKAIADDSIRLTSLQTGELDWIQRVPSQQAASLIGNSQLKHSPAQPFLPDLITFNCSQPPFNDQRVRQAFAWCIDRSEIAKLTFFSEGAPLTEAAPKGNPFYSGVDPYSSGPDPEKAKALLKAAGYEGLHVGFDGQTDVPTATTIGQILKEQVAKAGITLTITNYTAADWITRLLGLKYQVSETYFALNIDPAWIYYPLTLSTSGQNFCGFGTPRGDALLQKIMFNTDEAARKSAYADVVSYMADQAPIIFIDSELQQYWMKPNVSGPFPIPTLNVHCVDAWKS